MIPIQFNFLNYCIYIILKINLFKKSELFKDGAPFISSNIKIDFGFTKDFDCFDIKAIKPHFYVTDCINRTDSTNFWITVNFDDDKNPLYTIIPNPYVELETINERKMIYDFSEGGILYRI